MPAPPIDHPDVTVLRWPDDHARRGRLAELHRPRLLLVATDAEPPDVSDELEDWLREPVDPAELLARLGTLRRRADELMSVPVLDEDGLLRVGNAWVAVTDTQLGIVRLLLRRFGAVVRTQELADAYVASGGSGHAASVKAVIARLAARVKVVGLALTSVRARGVVLGYRTDPQ